MFRQNVCLSRLRSLLTLTLCLHCGGLATAADKSSTPQVFAPGIISTGNEFALTFTSDGATVYFTRRDQVKKMNHIYESHLRNGVWQTPVVVPFSSDEWSDLDPSLAPDGKRLFFISTRPKPESDAAMAEKKDMDIWYIDRGLSGWGTPVWIKAVSSPSKEGSPTVTRDGTLYFFSDRDAKADQDSIYVSKLVNGEYGAPVKLPATVNSGVYDASPFVAPNGKTLLFYSTRPGGSGGGDLYVSFFKHGQWQQAINLGKAVNTTEWEYNPGVSPNGETLYFGRSRQFYEIPVKSVGLKTLKPSRFTS
jgi:Tol biopolymer transport system component